MNTTDFIIPLDCYSIISQGSVYAESPSNIALVKYWGKKENQIPTNPSISFTLDKCRTQTALKFTKKQDDEIEIEVFLDKKKEDSFVPKIQKFIDNIVAFVPILNQFDLSIATSNSFPHSSGIASSASGMGALASCFVAMEEQMGIQFDEETKLKRISFLARLGSGSACRSVYPGLAIWGATSNYPNSSNLYAVSTDASIHPVYHHFHDAILLIHEGAKSISSSVGHQLMHNHPYAEKRFEEACRNLQKLLKIMTTDDLNAFIDLVEHEALSLHAMMLTSSPPFILMKPNTVAAIQKLWAFRRETKLPIGFTLDAGANMHILYPHQIKEAAESFINQELKPFCTNGKIIFDQVGQ